MKDRSLRMFMMICRKPQKDLKDFLRNWLKRYYDATNIYSEDGYLYAKGTDNILLTAHMDTVHKAQCKMIDCHTEKGGRRVLSSKDGIGGDDRCGIFMIMRIIETTKFRPTVLFCEDEEIGRVGAKKFVETKHAKDIEKMLFLIELDRAHSNDLVFYKDGNSEFHEFCQKTTGYKRAFGSFSDISTLAPHSKVSAVNISCGYYNQHKPEEYVVWDEMEDSINAAIKLITEGIAKNKAYTYKETASYSYYYGYGYDDYDEYDDYVYGYSYRSQLRRAENKYNLENGYGKSTTVMQKEEHTSDDTDFYPYEFITYNGYHYYGVGRNVKEAWGDVAMTNKALSYDEICTFKILNYEKKGWVV